jgi:hypothetical protein
MTTTTSDVAAAVSAYARRFHAIGGATHHVASPLGAWLLLALCASASTGRDRDALTEALGMDADAAGGAATALLENPHPLVMSAAAVWRRAVGDVSRVDAWAAGLARTVERGDLPSQAELDAWAREHTQGLIDRFPLDIREATMLLLATALATKVTWQMPFEVVPASRLGRPDHWAVEHVLEAPAGHLQFIASTEEAGDVAVHAAIGKAQHPYGLRVTSVIAAADVPADRVLAAAHRLAIRPRQARVRSLFDLATGEHPLWTITEQPVQTTSPNGQEERFVTVLPAWSARSEHDLDHAHLGMPAAAHALAQLLGLGEFQYEAKQSAAATYSRTGFEAAAVTGLDVALSAAPRSQSGLRRTAELRYVHPYAVVATAEHWVYREDAAWRGIPVFSAWVAEADESEADVSDVSDGPGQR